MGCAFGMYYSLMNLLFNIAYVALILVFKEARFFFIVCIERVYRILYLNVCELFFKHYSNHGTPELYTLMWSKWSLYV